MFNLHQPWIVVFSRALLLILFLAPQKGRAGEFTVLLPGGVPLTLVKVPAGTFQMGSPKGERGNLLDNETQHQVTLTHDYYLGKTELTLPQWTAVMGLHLSTECNDLFFLTINQCLA